MGLGYVFFRREPDRAISGRLTRTGGYDGRGALCKRRDCARRQGCRSI